MRLTVMDMRGRNKNYEGTYAVENVCVVRIDTADGRVCSAAWVSLNHSATVYQDRGPNAS